MAEIVEGAPAVISGNPNSARICTSHVERQNLTMRMHQQEFENYRAAIALPFAITTSAGFVCAARYTHDGRLGHEAGMDVNEPISLMVLT